ncbi:hypothetical protein HOLleu_14470 [Holothuria leucospilota]|uniref:Uncharacterized protein n=1 Tax=Holothuria leucospilota TaxID=206669 RepID=A0A9Q1C8D0_HOLLE|nr:hypothetical protein HOLleu_14470 [Holothuria leucospilota]
MSNVRGVRGKFGSYFSGKSFQPPKSTWVPTPMGTIATLRLFSPLDTILQLVHYNVADKGRSSTFLAGCSTGTRFTLF